MKKLLIILISCFLLIGCKTSKISTSELEEIYQQRLLESITKIQSLEKEKTTYKDSLLYIKGLIEQSSSFGLDSSYLETSYARSLALIDKEGKLHHNLENKDSIPSRIIFQEKYIYKDRIDSVFINKTDTIYQTKIKEEVKIEKLKFLDKFKYICLGIVIGLVGIFIIKLFYKK